MIEERPRGRRPSRRASRSGTSDGERERKKDGEREKEREREREREREDKESDATGYEHLKADGHGAVHLALEPEAVIVLFQLLQLFRCRRPLLRHRMRQLGSADRSIDLHRTEVNIYVYHLRLLFTAIYLRSFTHIYLRRTDFG